MEQKSVLIGMSGGVDSSVAAALLSEQGYRVVGATMRLWSCADRNGGAYRKESAIEDARRVADKLGIEFYVIDFRDIFRDKVVDYFVSEYIHGRTPNPCIACNKHIKFDALLQKAREMGIDYIATGHYARIERGESGRCLLRTGKSAEKDQSYVLYNLTQEQLSHTLMPLGAYEKDWVREKAADMGLDVAHKKDSQEICFVEDDDYARFITEYSGYKPEEGDILDINGNKIGTHRGLIYYTIGQRKGIGAYGRPMFVMKLDEKTNTITLGEKGMEFSDTLTASDINFISGEIPESEIRVSARIRYHAEAQDALLIPLGDGRARLVFDKKIRAVTAGQAVVFYDGDTVLGGGTVE